MKNWKENFANFNHSIDDMLIGAGTLTSSEGLLVYQSDYNARLFEALSKNYEATWVVLGDDDFMELTKEYIKLFPSNSYTLNSYGENFPEFISEKNVDIDVINMAKFELAFWKLFHSPTQSRQTLTPQQIENGKFNLAPVELISSKLNLKLVWDNRENGISEDNQTNLYDDFYFVLYKSNQKVEVINLNQNQFIFLSELKKKNYIKNISNCSLGESDWNSIFSILSCVDYNLLA